MLFEPASIWDLQQAVKAELSVPKNPRPGMTGCNGSRCQREYLIKSCIAGKTFPRGPEGLIFDPGFKFGFHCISSRRVLISVTRGSMDTGIGPGVLAFGCALALASAGLLVLCRAA